MAAILNNAITKSGSSPVAGTLWLPWEDWQLGGLPTIQLTKAIEHRRRTGSTHQLEQTDPRSNLPKINQGEFDE